MSCYVSNTPYLSQEVESHESKWFNGGKGCIISLYLSENIMKRAGLENMDCRRTVHNHYIADKFAVAENKSDLLTSVEHTRESEKANLFLHYKK